MIYNNLRLKELRTALSPKPTQTDLADFLGIKLRTYQDYEAGKVDIPSSKLIALADYFDVSLDYLVGRSDRKENW